MVFNIHVHTYPINRFAHQEFSFLMPMWLICSCFSTCYCNTSGITIHLPLMTTPSITAMSSLNVQYVLMSCGSWLLLSGHFYMTYAMRCRRCWSWDVASCSSCVVIHSGLFVVDCTALIFIHKTAISLSLFSLWFCLDIQSAINRSGPGLYMILTLYWCILNRIHWSLCDK